MLSGPEVAARAVCKSDTVCAGIQLFGPGATTRLIANPSMGLVPVPRIFLTAAKLLVEMRGPGGKREDWFVLDKEGVKSPLPELPTGLQVASISGIADGGGRFSLDGMEKTGLCGGIDLWCKARGQALVVDVPTNKIVFQQEMSGFGGISALSPDGRRLAILDRGRLTVYGVP